MNKSIESQFYELAEQLSEEAYERNASGEISVALLKELYNEIREWALHTERLLSLLQNNKISIKNINNYT